MDTFNIDRAQLAALGQREFPFIQAPDFHEARDKAQFMGLVKVRDSMCLGNGWGFYGQDTNGVAAIAEVFTSKTKYTTACPATLELQWHNMKEKRK